MGQNSVQIWGVSGSILGAIQHPEVWAVVNADLRDARAKLEDIECMFNPDGQEID